MSIVAIVGSTFTYYLPGLEDQANPGLFKAAPTIAAGDFTISTNGGAFEAMDNTPTVTPTGGKQIKFILSIAETTAAGDGGTIVIECSDASGAEWFDVAINVPVRAADLSVLGGTAQTGDAYARLGAPAGASVSADVLQIKNYVDDIGAAGAGLTAIPTVAAVTTVGSVTGAVGSVTGAVGSIAANGITATSIAADAINAAAVKADAVTKIQNGLATPTNITAGTITTVTNLTNAPTNGDLTATMKTSVTTAATAATPIAASVTGAVGSVTGAVGSVTGAVGSVTGAVGSVTAPVTAGTVSDKTGYALSSAGVQAIWDALTSALSAVGSIGKRLADNIDATISSRGTSTYAGADTAGTTTLLGRIIGTLATGTHNPQTGDAFARLGAAGAGLTALPWNAAWDAEVQSEAQDAITASALATAANLATLTGYVDTEVAAILAAVDTEVAAIVATVGVAGAGLTALATQASVNDLPTNAELATALGTADDAVLAILGTPVGASVSADIAAVKANATAAEAYGSLTYSAVTTMSTYVDTEVAAILAAVDTEVAAIKAKTDNLPASPAAVGSAMTLTAAYDAAKTAATQASVDDLPTNAELATSQAAADDATLAAIAALNNLSSAQAQTAATAALNAYDPPTNAEMEARTLVSAGYATASALLAVDDYVDTEVAAIKAVTDKIDTALVLDGAVYQLTANALELAPTGAGSGASAQEVWEYAGIGGRTINSVSGTVTARLADGVTHGGSAASLDLRKLSVINTVDNDPAVYLEAKHTPVLESYAVLTALGHYGWEVSDGVLATLFPELVTEATLRSNLRIVTGALSSPVATTAAIDQDLYGTDAYVGWLLFLEYSDHGLKHWAARVVSHTATTVTVDDTIPDAGTFWLLPNTGLVSQEIRDAMKLAPTAGVPAADSIDADLDAIRLVTDAIDTSAVTVTSTNDAGVLTITRGVTFAATVSGLTISATWAKLYFTLKESDYDDDDDAIVQIVETNPGAGTDGLLYLNSAAIASPITVADGTLTVNQAGGTVAIAITDNATVKLAKASGLVWDIKTKDAAGATVENATGTASIVRAITQTI